MEMFVFSIETTILIDLCMYLKKIQEAISVKTKNVIIGNKLFILEYRQSKYVIRF